MFTEGCRLNACGGMVCGMTMWVVCGGLGMGGILVGAITGSVAGWAPLAIGLIVGGSLALFIGIGGAVLMYRATRLKLNEESSRLNGLNTPFRKDNL